MSRGLHSRKYTRSFTKSEGAMSVRLILIAVVAVIAVAGGLMFYGYSQAPTPEPVHVVIPNDQFPQ